MARVIKRAGAPWQPAVPGNESRRISCDQGVPLDVPNRAAHRTSRLLDGSISTGWRLPWFLTKTFDRSASWAWGSVPRQVQPAMAAPWVGIMTPRDPDTVAAWGVYARAPGAEPVMPWSAPPIRDRAQSTDWRPQFGARWEISRRLPWGAPRSNDRETRIPWGEGIRILPPWLPPPPPPVIPPGVGRVVPIYPVYFQMNIATFKRLPDNTPLDFRSFRVVEDVETFGARWSGQIIADHLSLVEPNGPVRHEIEATINGHVWRLLVESASFDERLPSKTVNVSGRGRVAALAAPLAQPRDYIEVNTRSMAQLADQEVTGSGWSTIWDTENWLVPPGAWTYEDLTPIQAISRIAQAAGAVLATDPAEKTITIRPRYIYSPWQWGTQATDWQIPRAVAIRRTYSYDERPAYNGVVVSGTNVGVIGNVTRQGTAGDLQAKPVADPLITHQDGARERGRNILCAGGTWSLERLELPLQEPDGDIARLRPLELVEYADVAGSWRGQVASVEVSVTRGDALSIRQRVLLERRHD